MPFKQLSYRSRGDKQRKPDIIVHITFPEAAVTDQWSPEQIRAARQFLKECESALKSLSITIGTRQ